jgi:predicted nucleic acid-binding protein
MKSFIAKGPDAAYVDTSAFIALVDRSDAWHAFFRRQFARPPALVTTELVIAEGHGWFVHHYDAVQALQFLAMVETMAPLTVLAVGPEERAAAVDLMIRHPSDKLTLADAVGLHVMETRGIGSCWSVDERLTLTGVPLVIERARQRKRA